MRKLSPVLYLYVEAKKAKETTEYLYFSSLSRTLNYSLKVYDNLNTFKKETKNKLKQDVVAAVIDFDVDGSNLQNSLSSREKSILEIQSKVADVHIYLSNRFWENWIVYHFEDYNRFEEDAFKLPIPSYKKDKNWYYTNMPILLSEMETAKKRAKQRRTRLAQLFPAHCSDELPKLDHGNLKKMYESQAFSYVDILIGELQNLSS